MSKTSPKPSIVPIDLLGLKEKDRIAMLKWLEIDERSTRTATRTAARLKALDLHEREVALRERRLANGSSKPVDDTARAQAALDAIVAETDARESQPTRQDAPGSTIKGAGGG